MKNEAKIAAAIYLLVEAGYVVTKRSALPKKLLESDAVPTTTPEKSVDQPRGDAMNVPEFIARYKVGRTVAYAEIASGRLATYKVGRRRYISEAAAQEWQKKMESGT